MKGSKATTMKLDEKTMRRVRAIQEWTDAKSAHAGLRDCVGLAFAVMQWRREVADIEGLQKIGAASGVVGDPVDELSRLGWNVEHWARLRVELLPKPWNHMITADDGPDEKPSARV